MERDPAMLPLEATEFQGEAQSAVSWSAIVAGATAALALSFLLLALAAGFGLKLPQPWPGARNDLAHFSPTLGAALIVVQVLSGALGGYLAGRLRTKWTHAHGHEVHFRDTAHGLLAWAASTLAGLVLAGASLAPLAATEPAPTTAGAATYTAPTIDASRLDQRAVREANLSAQFSLFLGIGLLLSAFTACVAAALGGLRRDEMHAAFWTERARAPDSAGQ